jgi:hypothetical protein
MCFWFGLEILRLVYKKAFLKYFSISILFDLLSSEKSFIAPYKSFKKNFFKRVSYNSDRKKTKKERKKLAVTTVLSNTVNLGLVSIKYKNPYWT